MGETPLEEWETWSDCLSWDLDSQMRGTSIVYVQWEALFVVHTRCWKIMQQKRRRRNGICDCDSWKQYHRVCLFLIGRFLAAYIKIAVKEQGKKLWCAQSWWVEQAGVLMVLECAVCLHCAHEWFVIRNQAMCAFGIKQIWLVMRERDQKSIGTWLDNM